MKACGLAVARGFAASCMAAVIIFTPFVAESAAPAKGDKPARTASAKDGAKKVSYDEAFPAVKLAPLGEEEKSVLERASKAYSQRDYAKAVELLTPLAEKGSARAAFSLGLMAVRGHGMPMSTETAEKWWTQAAKAGFPDAQYHLGFMHHQALRGPRNPEFIAHLWRLAAAKGQGDAMFGLGYMYRAGDGVPKDMKKSAKMFQDAANLGHPGAFYELALMYRSGRGGVAKNEAKAKEYLKKAADAGVPQALQDMKKK